MQELCLNGIGYIIYGAFIAPLIMHVISCWRELTESTLLYRRNKWKPHKIINIVAPPQASLSVKITFS